MWKTRWEFLACISRSPSITAPSRQGTRALPYKNIAYYSGRTGSSAPTKKCPVGRDPCVPPHTAPLAKNLSLRASDQHHRCGDPYPLRCASGGPLSFFGERKGGKNAVKTKVLKSFPRLRCRLHRSSLPRVSGCANFAPCFRIVSASPSATRSALVLPWRDGGRPLRLPHSGRRDAAPYGGLSVNGA